MNAVVPTAARAEEMKSGHLYLLISDTKFLPIVFQTITDIEGTEKTPTKKAIVQPSISATRVNKESVETINIPLADKNKPKGLPERENCFIFIIGGLYLKARSGHMLFYLKRFI